MAKIPAFKLKLGIEGENVAVDLLLGIAERSHEAKPVLAVIQELMRRGAEEQFFSEGSRGGLRWVPDKPNTIEKKLAAGYPTNHTEIMTTRLLASLQKRSGGGDAIRRLSRHSTTFGTRVFYAHWQGHKRQLLGITTRDADSWAERMATWLVEGRHTSAVR